MAAPLGRCGCQNFVRNYVIALSRCLGHGRRCQQHTSATQEKDSSQQSESQDPKNIVVPRRKKWDGMSVLHALASTVETDFKSPHYKYIDDPFLIPTGAPEKRRYTLAKASGRKAAKYVVEQHPDLFEFSRAEPRIEAFMPDGGFKHADNTEAGLVERIQTHSPLAAWESYQKLKEAGHSASHATLTDLLALLCVFNSEEPSSSLEPEEQFFKRDIVQDNTNKIKKTWKDHGSAEQLFAEMSEKSPLDYSHMIRGRAKYLATDKAHKLYEDMKQQNIPVDLEAYNALLKTVSFLSDRTEQRWQAAKEILADMSSAEVHPTVDTFNSVLYMISRNNRFVQSPVYAMEVLNEMKRLGIEPSLGTWFYIINIFYPNNDSTSTVLNDIINNMEGKEFILHDQVDLEFFSKAMVVCFNLKDLDLAIKLDQIANTGSNILLLGEGFKEGVYYTYFLRLLCMFEQIDTIMQYYEKFTPHVYSPSYTALDELLRAIELNEGYQYLPKIWSDLVVFSYTKKNDLVEPLLSSMARQKQEPKLQETFAQITNDLKSRLEEDLADTRIIRTLRLTGNMIGDLVLINMNAGNFDNAWEFFQLYLKNKYEMENFPSQNSLVSLAETCIEQQNVDKLMQCLEVMSDCAYPKLDSLISQAQTEMSFTDEQKGWFQGVPKLLPHDGLPVFLYS